MLFVATASCAATLHQWSSPGLSHASKHVGEGFSSWSPCAHANASAMPSGCCRYTSRCSTSPHCQPFSPRPEVEGCSVPVQDQQDRGKDWQVVKQGLLMAS